MNEESFIFNKNSYVAFDGTSLRDIIIERLNRGKVFTDQNYQGSNLSAIIDVVSYCFSNLLFYLNKTSSESLFSEAQLYENMNRIVKLMNYKPLGPQTQSLPIKITVEQLSKGNYIIPRYSYISVGTSTFSTNKDISFTKLTNNISENITNLDNVYNFYQGIFEEYPKYTSIGTENETLYLAVDSKIKIDNFNIDVYVKKYNTNIWEKWTRVNDLFLYKASDTVYEVRYNENKRYEIIFGNDINGKKLGKSDMVSVYYLKINENANNIGANSLSNATLVRYNSVEFSNILNDTGLENSNFLSPLDILNVKINNDFPSTNYSPEETVDNIRENAPQNFKSQNRLVTISDYEVFVKTNFKNIISDVKVLSNDDYLKQHIKYLYDNGLNNPQENTKILFNQIKFSNSCNFNNLYFYLVPSNEGQEYLTQSQKQLILDHVQQHKTITTQIVPTDPVYVYLDFYLKKADSLEPSVDDINQTKLLVLKSVNTRRSSSAIELEIKNIFETSFSRKNSKLGNILDIYELSNKLINIEGVDNIQTYRIDTGFKINGLSFLLWNPTYKSSDISVITQNITLENFKYLIFNNINSILDRIEVIDSSNVVKIADF
jgi:hypothetical protein